MDTALDKHTGEVVDAEQLWVINPVDKLGYECRGCGVLAAPCSFKPDNHVRPYFRAEPSHKHGCDVEGEVGLVRRARKQRVTTREVFPGSFPNRLVFRDSRPVTDMNLDPDKKMNGSERHSDSNGVNKIQKNYRWAAGTIRPICRTFINYPHDRDLPLSVPDVEANNYKLAFRSLNNGSINQYSDKRIFYGPISWKRLVTDNEDHLEIQLSYGEWVDGKLVRPYFVNVDWRRWSVAKRNSVSKEIEIARNEYMEAKKSENKEKGWLFFIGKQDETYPAIFHVYDHRLICCLVAEMIYPNGR